LQFALELNYSYFYSTLTKKGTSVDICSYSVFCVYRFQCAGHALTFSHCC